MCGICGIINIDGTPVNPDVIISMRDVMSNRGPDDKGAVLLRGASQGRGERCLRFQELQEIEAQHLNSGYNIGLAHRRLSIIDLSHDGRQPMSNETETVWITFNGEIYNFLELRQELEVRGHRFRTRTDTEVIVQAYEEWGTDFVCHLRGMFAIAIWDVERSLCVLTRDRFGIKPLFYYWDGKHLIFSSDINSLMLSGLIEPEISPESVLQYFKYHYIPAPNTIYKEVYAVLPGEELVVFNGYMDKREFWQPCLAQTISDEKEAIELVESKLKEAVDIHLVADVPIGSFLSGGVDSSLVTLFAKEITGDINAFCIGFREPEFDESSYARMVADRLGVSLKVDMMEQVPPFEEIIKIVDCCDQPFADSSLIATYQVCRNARHYFPVALSGDGGDEVFAGYGFRLQNISSYSDRHPMINGVMNAILSAGKMLGTFNRFAIAFERLKNFKGRSLAQRYIFYHIKSQQADEIVHPDVSKAGEPHPDFIKSQVDRHGLPNNLEGMLALCIKNNLPNDMLVKVDRASMANSLEVRVPFLDHRLVETAFMLASSLKQPGIIRTRPKYILKKIAERNLPHESIYRKKKGFSVPMGKWADTKINSYLTEVFNSIPRSVYDYLNPDIARRIDNPQEMTLTYTDQWALFCFFIWHDRHQKSKHICKRI